jgi:transposase
VILQHDNARTHTANITKAAIQELDWKILPHPPYYPDPAPSDYHLFLSLSNDLRGVSFNNDTELQNWLDDNFKAKPADFFKRGIQNVGRQS